MYIASVLEYTYSCTRQCTCTAVMCIYWNLVQYPGVIRGPLFDIVSLINRIKPPTSETYTNLVRVYSQESMYPVVGPWSISGQNWPLTTDRQIHDPLWWPRPLTAHWPPDTWSTLVTMLMTTIIFVVSGQWSVVRRAKKNWPYSPENFNM